MPEDPRPGLLQMLQGLLMLLNLLDHLSLLELVFHHQDQLVVNFVGGSFRSPFQDFKTQPEDNFLGQHGENESFCGSESHGSE